MHSTQFIWNLRPKWTMMQQSGKTPPKDKSELLPNGMYDLKGNQPHLFAKFKRVKNIYQDAHYEQYQRQVMQEYNQMMENHAKAPIYVRMRNEEGMPPGEPTEDTIQQISMARIKSFRDKAQQGNLTNAEKAILEKLTLETSTEFVAKFPKVYDPETGKEIDSTDWLLNLFAPEVSAPVVQRGNIVSRIPRVPQLQTALSKFDQEKNKKEKLLLEKHMENLNDIMNSVNHIKTKNQLEAVKKAYGIFASVRTGTGGGRAISTIQLEMARIVRAKMGEVRAKLNKLQSNNNLD